MIVTRSGPSGWDILGWCLLAIVSVVVLAGSFAWVCAAWCDQESEVITETVVHEDAPAGTLKRKWWNGQPYVIDPSDKTKMWVNTTDDKYEDTAGRVWWLS